MAAHSDLKSSSVSSDGLRSSKVGVHERRHTLTGLASATLDAPRNPSTAKSWSAQLLSAHPFGECIVNIPLARCSLHTRLNDRLKAFLRRYKKVLSTSFLTFQTPLPSSLSSQNGEFPLELPPYQAHADPSITAHCEMEVLREYEKRMSRYEAALTRREGMVGKLASEMEQGKISSHVLKHHSTALIDIIKKWNALFESADPFESNSIPVFPEMNEMSLAHMKQANRQRRLAYEARAQVCLDRERALLQTEEKILAALSAGFESLAGEDYQASLKLIATEEELVARCRLAQERKTKAEPVDVPLYIGIATARSHRLKMEDRFTISDKLPCGGSLFAVFDGHGGKRISEWAALHLPNTFADQMSKNKSDLLSALKGTLEELHASAKSYFKGAKVGGSTAVICYYSRADGLFYTATLGDSTADIWFRTERGLRHSSLSATQNWATAEDAQRAEAVTGQGFALHAAAKTRRLAWKGFNLNVSRALGNFPIETALSRTPTITCFPIQDGDTIVIATDGWSDHASPSLLETAAHVEKRDQLAHHLKEQSLAHQDTRYCDNVTILTLQFGGGAPEGTSASFN